VANTFNKQNKQLTCVIAIAAEVPINYLQFRKLDVVNKTQNRQRTRPSGDAPEVPT